MAVAEVFRQMAVQVVAAAMLVGALHSALKHREVTLNGVGGDTALAGVFLSAVLHGMIDFT